MRESAVTVWIGMMGSGVLSAHRMEGCREARVCLWEVMERIAPQIVVFRDVNAQCRFKGVEQFLARVFAAASLGNLPPGSRVDRVWIVLRHNRLVPCRSVVDALLCVKLDSKG